MYVHILDGVHVCVVAASFLYIYVSIVRNATKTSENNSNATISDNDALGQATCHVNGAESAPFKSSTERTRWGWIHDDNCHDNGHDNDNDIDCASETENETVNLPTTITDSTNHCWIYTQAL
jgi:hypothetical protein